MIPFSWKKGVLWIVFILFLSGGLGYTQEGAEQAISVIQSTTVEEAIRHLRGDSRKDKLLAIEVLQASGSADKEVIDALVSCLFEGTLFKKRIAAKTVNDFWEVRMKSAETLGNIGDPRALPGLHRALRYEPDYIVKTSIAIAIGKVGEPESIPHLARTIELYMHSSSEVMVVGACVDALGEIRHRDAYYTFYKVYRDCCESELRLAAKKA